MNGNGRPPPVWTVDKICPELAEQYGVYVSPRHLRGVIRFLPGFTAIAEEPPGSSGGRGAKLYCLADLQVLADFLIRHGWLQSEPLTPEQERDRKRGVGARAERAARRRLVTEALLPSGVTAGNYCHDRLTCPLRRPAAWSPSPRVPSPPGISTGPRRAAGLSPTPARPRRGPSRRPAHPPPLPTGARRRRRRAAASPPPAAGWVP